MVSTHDDSALVEERDCRIEGALSTQHAVASDGRAIARPIVQKPWLLLPAKFAHDVAPIGLDILASFTSPVEANIRSFDWSRPKFGKTRSIHFRNPLGIAGGVDKDGKQIEGWQHFGAGFVEVGTVTPSAQKPNSGRIIGRDNNHEALWNRMGFPGKGAHFVRSHVRDFRNHEMQNENAGLVSPFRLPIFLNIGKQRTTSLENASADYTWLIDFFSRTKNIFEIPPIDCFVINISSPNTAGLRELFAKDRLYEFLAPLAEKLNTYAVPGLLKLSPDMDVETLQSAVDVSVRLDIDGFIATNTTASRPFGIDFPKEGGLSGAPLKLRSREVLQNLIELLGSHREGRLIVSAGGVLSGEEAAVRLKMGANLVQTYSGLVFHGPRFFDVALRELVTPSLVR